MKLEKFVEKSIVAIGLLFFGFIIIMGISLSSYAPLFWGLIIIPIYFVPIYISQKNNHKNKLQILLLNILLGFTYIGWVAALIWATMDDKKGNNGI